MGTKTIHQGRRPARRHPYGKRAPRNDFVLYLTADVHRLLPTQATTYYTYYDDSYGYGYGDDDDVRCPCGDVEISSKRRLLESESQKTRDLMYTDRPSTREIGELRSVYYISWLFGLSTTRSVMPERGQRSSFDRYAGRRHVRLR